MREQILKALIDIIAKSMGLTEQEKLSIQPGSTLNELDIEPMDQSDIHFRLQKELGIRISLNDFLGCGTVEQMLALVMSSQPPSHARST